MGYKTAAKLTVPPSQIYKHLKGSPIPSGITTHFPCATATVLNAIDSEQFASAKISPTAYSPDKIPDPLNGKLGMRLEPSVQVMMEELKLEEDSGVQVLRGVTMREQVETVGGPGLM